MAAATRNRTNNTRIALTTVQANTANPRAGCQAIMFVMLYLGFKRWWIAPIIYLGILVSASGGFIMLALWGVAVWVGFLMLFGVVDDADGVVIIFGLMPIFWSTGACGLKSPGAQSQQRESVAIVRRKLGDSSELHKHLTTVRGVGYMLVA